MATGEKIMVSFETGQFVFSKAGRDKGNIFVIMSVEDGYAYIADGVLRSAEKPKKKKLMHLQPIKYKDEYLIGRISENNLSNSDVKKAIKMYNEK